MTHALTPRREELALIVVDPQGSIFKAMEPDVRLKTISNIKLLITAAQQMHIPTLLTEQYPKGLGASLDEIKQALADYQPIEKVSFSCCGAGSFMGKLRQMTAVKSAIICGIETHVCVLQTALDLLADGYRVYIPADAACSRRKLDWQVGLKQMDKAGAVITTSETLVFQLLGKAGTEDFKVISKLLG